MKNKETLEEAAENYIENTMKFSFSSLDTKTQANRMLKCVEFGAKWQKERMYSEEEAYKIWKAGQEYWKTSGESKTFEEFIEQFKKK